LNAPDESLGPLRRKDGDPVFDEPWQAQALAMADSLVKNGTLSAGDWAAKLGAELRLTADAGAPDNAETYYLAVLAALEKLLDDAGAAVGQEVQTRREEWERAYLNTPHGRPVELSAGKK
jgi:nitrile hydratase accessory protein